MRNIAEVFVKHVSADLVRFWDCSYSKLNHTFLINTILPQMKVIPMVFTIRIIITVDAILYLNNLAEYKEFAKVVQYMNTKVEYNVLYLLKIKQ